MQEVKLVEVNKKWNNAQHEIDIKKADDIFALGDRGRSFLRVGTLTKLVFRVWFEGVDKPRLVTLRWPPRPLDDHRRHGARLGVPAR